MKQKTVDDAETHVQAHDDVIVGVALLAGGNETIVSVGLDSKSVGNCNSYVHVSLSEQT